MRIITCGRKVRGTCHADDLSYLFYNAGAKKLKHRTAEYKTIRRMISILVQFAECGNPNIPNATTATNISVTPTTVKAIVTETQTVAVAVKASTNGDVTTTTTENGSDSNSNCSSDSGSGSGSDGTITTESDGVANVADAADVTDTTFRVDPWLPLSKDDKVFKCLNISDELEVIDLPETDKLKLWDSMYEQTELLY